MMLTKQVLGLLCLVAGAATGCWAATDTPLGPNGKMGVEIAQDGGFEKARRYLEDGIAESPDNPVLYEYLGLS